MSTKVYLLYYKSRLPVWSASFNFHSRVSCGENKYIMLLKNYWILSVIILLLAGLTNCQTEETTPVINIDARLLPYFERFESEASARGIEAPITTLVSGKLAEVGGDVVGQCEHYTNSPNVILVDQQYWQNAKEFEKEYLIFHELGHCYLERNHLDEKNVAGNCISIMQSGQGNCRMTYNYSTREAYLDELFN